MPTCTVAMVPPDGDALRRPMKGALADECTGWLIHLPAGPVCAPPRVESPLTPAQHKPAHMPGGPATGYYTITRLPSNYER